MCACVHLSNILNAASLVQTISFYASSILGGLFINSTIPLFFEMAVEAAFPISEGIAAVLIMLLNNAFTVIFLAILLIRDIGKTLISDLLRCV